MPTILRGAVFGFLLCFALPAGAAPTNAPPAAQTNVSQTNSRLTNTGITNAGISNAPPRNTTHSYWEETMEFGTPDQKLDVLKQMRQSKHSFVADILVKALAGESDEKVRKEIIQILYEKKDPRALDPLLASLKMSTSPDVLASTLAALGQLGDKRAISHITNFLTHENREVVQSAVRTLGKIGDEAVAAILLAMLTDPKTDSEVTYDLVNALGELKYKPAFPELRKIAVNTAKPNYLRAFAVTALGRIGDTRALDVFLTMLKTEKNSIIRARVIAALGEMKTEQSVQYLKVALGDADKTIRYQAVQAAGKSGSRALVPALLYRLKYDEEPKIMVAAAEALQALGHKAATAIVIKKFESSRDNGILISLLAVLEKENAREAIPVLRKKQLEMKNSSIKDRIETLLKKWGTAPQTKPADPVPGTKTTTGGQTNKQPGNRVYLQ